MRGGITSGRRASDHGPIADRCVAGARRARMLPLHRGAIAIVVAGLVGLSPVVCEARSATDEGPRKSNSVPRNRATAPAANPPAPVEQRELGLRAKEIEGIVWLSQDDRRQRLRAGQPVGVGQSVGLEPKARATLATADGLSLDLGTQARFSANWAGRSGPDLNLRVDAGTLGVQIGERGGAVTILLGDLRTKLQPGRYFFENSAGPTGVAIACAYEGNVTLGSDWGAAGHLGAGQCVALEGLSGAGPILLRSIAMVPEWNAPAASTPAQTAVAVVEPRPAPSEGEKRVLKASPPPVAAAQQTARSGGTVEGTGKLLPAPAPTLVSTPTTPSPTPTPTPTPTLATPPPAPPSRSPERWIVNVASFADPADAKAMAQRLRGGGFEVALREDLVRGAPSFRTVISGLENEEAAKKVVERLDREYGYRSAWALRSR